MDGVSADGKVHRRITNFEVGTAMPTSKLAWQGNRLVPIFLAMRKNREPNSFPAMPTLKLAWQGRRAQHVGPALDFDTRLP